MHVTSRDCWIQKRRKDRERCENQLANCCFRHARLGLDDSCPTARRFCRFFPEGIQKLAFPEILGAGRFSNIGIPHPAVMGPFVGTVEIICGALIILGLLTRLAAIPLIVIMIVAIVSTKVPILLGHDFRIFHVPKLPRYGFWSMAHEARADFCMLLGSLYLLIEGGGRWSLDALVSNNPQAAR